MSSEVWVCKTCKKKSKGRSTKFCNSCLHKRDDAVVLKEEAFSIYDSLVSAQEEVRLDMRQSMYASFIKELNNIFSSLQRGGSRELPLDSAYVSLVLRNSPGAGVAIQFFLGYEMDFAEFLWDESTVLDYSALYAATEKVLKQVYPAAGQSSLYAMFLAQELQALTNSRDSKRKANKGNGHPTLGAGYPDNSSGQTCKFDSDCDNYFCKHTHPNGRRELCVNYDCVDPACGNIHRPDSSHPNLRLLPRQLLHESDETLQLHAAATLRKLRCMHDADRICRHYKCPYNHQNPQVRNCPDGDKCPNQAWYQSVGGLGKRLPIVDKCEFLHPVHSRRELGRNTYISCPLERRCKDYFCEFHHVNQRFRDEKRAQQEVKWGVRAPSALLSTTHNPTSTSNNSNNNNNNNNSNNTHSISQQPLQQPEVLLSNNNNHHHLDGLENHNMIMHNNNVDPSPLDMEPRTSLSVIDNDVVSINNTAFTSIWNTADGINSSLNNNNSSSAMSNNMSNSLSTLSHDFMAPLSAVTGSSSADMMSFMNMNMMFTPFDANTYNAYGSSSAPESQMNFMPSAMPPMYNPFYSMYPTYTDNSLDQPEQKQ